MRIPKQMQERIIRMANKTWDMIASDCLRGIEEEGKDPIMPRSHVVEVVCDADYMLSYGEDKEAYTYWDKLPTYEDKIRVVKKAFPFKKYGY